MLDGSLVFFYSCMTVFFFIELVIYKRICYTLITCLMIKNETAKTTYHGTIP